LRSPRDVASVAAPLLTSGLDRAVTLAELLEVRAFGSTASAEARARWSAVAVAGMAGASCIAVYLFAMGRGSLAVIAAGIALALAGAVMLANRHARAGRTRYRPLVWTQADAIVVVGSIIAIVALAAALRWSPDVVRYEPYPSLAWPQVSLPLLVGLTGLAAPAAATLTVAEDRG
jgi:energy-coupling factor transporter transmembrane protein EcfT